MIKCKFENNNESCKEIANGNTEKHTKGCFTIDNLLFEFQIFGCLFCCFIHLKKNV